LAIQSGLISLCSDMAASISGSAKSIRGPQELDMNAEMPIASLAPAPFEAEDKSPLLPSGWACLFRPVVSELLWTVWLPTLQKEGGRYS
jgi:hypothetical protein